MPFGVRVLKSASAAIAPILLAVGLADAATPPAVNRIAEGSPSAVSTPRLRFVHGAGEEIPRRLGVELEELRPGDVLAVAGPESAFRPDPAESGLWRAPAAGTSSWTREAAGSRAAVTLDLAALRPGEWVEVSVRRPDAVGDVRVSRTAGRTLPGSLLLSEPTVARSRRMVRLGGVPPAALPPGEAADAEGYLRLVENHPALGRLRTLARSAETYLEVTGGGGGVSPSASVSGESDFDVDFSGYPCSSGVNFGSGIDVTSAPSGATITAADITTWRAYHSVDVSKFRLTFWNRPFSGTWDSGSVVEIYAGGSTGANWKTDSRIGIHNLDGRSVNRQYSLSGCNYSAASTTTFIDYWALTLFYGSSPTVDLVADAITLGASPVTAGSSVSAVFSGHVGGSGAVGSPFSIGFYLSGDATVTTSDLLLRHDTDTWATTAGQSFGYGSPGISLTIPGSVAPGNYTIGMIVDDTGVVAETSEGNNVVTAPIAMAAAGSMPNLQALSCSLSASSAAPGTTLTFTWSATNSGTVGSAAFVWGLYLSTDSTITFSDTFLAALDAPGGWSAGANTGNVVSYVTLPSSLPNGTYHVGLLLDSTGAVAETSEADNTCSDSLSVGGSGGGETRWLIPAAASAPGVGSSNWKTQLGVANPGSASRVARVYYVASGQPWPGALLSGPRTIAPNQTWYLDDPLAGLNPTSGLLYLVADGPGLLPTSRTYNLASGDATFGQGIPAILLDGTAAPTEYVFPMVHSRSGRYRANLGLVQAGTSVAMTVAVDVFTSTGTLAASGAVSTSAAYKQVNDLFTSLGIGGTSVEGGWIRIRKTSGSPEFWTTYLSVVDATTNDPTYFEPMAP